MKIPILIEFLQLLKKMLGRDQPHYTVPDIRSIRLADAQREVEIERALAEHARLKSERIKRDAEPSE